MQGRDACTRIREECPNAHCPYGVFFVLLFYMHALSFGCVLQTGKGHVFAVNSVDFTYRYRNTFPEPKRTYVFDTGK